MKLRAQFFRFSSADSTASVKSFLTHCQGKQLLTPRVELGGIRSKWPACLGPGESGAPLLIRKDVAEIISEASLTGLSLTSVDVAVVNGKDASTREVPTYLLATALGFLKTEIAVYEITQDSPRQYQYRFTAPDSVDPRMAVFKRPPFGKFNLHEVPIVSEWSGDDFFNTSIKRESAWLNCSRRFVDLAYDKKWDNISFYPIDSLGLERGDFRNLSWPPEKWYPASQPDYFGA